MLPSAAITLNGVVQGPHGSVPLSSDNQTQKSENDAKMFPTVTAQPPPTVMEVRKDDYTMKKNVKTFSYIQGQLAALYPQVPSKVLLLEFKKYRQESQRLTGKLVSEILKEVEMRVDFLLQHLTMEELEFVAEGTGSGKRYI